MVTLPHVPAISSVCIIASMAFIQDFGHMLKITGCFEKDLGLYAKP